MAEGESSSNNEITINIKGPSELKLQITISLDKTVADLKHAIAEKSDVPADRQRLIYSGRVLKDDDLLSGYKIQNLNTIHMVKGAARSPNTGGPSSTTGPTPQQLPTMQTGQNPADPLTQLNGIMGHGLMAGFNPFADLGLNPNDPNMMTGMLNNPQFLQQMSTLMSNPAILDQIIASNPQLASMGPQVRQMMQSEQFRNIVSNPDMLANMLRMSAMLRGDGGLGGNPFGGGAGSFPAPGMPSYAQPSSPTSQQQPNSTNAFNPSAYPPFPPPTTGTGDANRAAAGAAPGSPGAGAAPNPFAGLAGLLGSMPPPQQNAAGAGIGGAASPFGMVDPALVQQLLGGFGGPLGAPTSPPAPADTRPAEERFQVQLQQLQDMGFVNAQQNVRALLATAGNVHAAIEYILNGGGI